MNTQGQTVNPVYLSVLQAKIAFERGQLESYKPLKSLRSAGSPSTPMASWGPMMKK
jgi:hypothetical protein